MDSDWWAKVRKARDGQMSDDPKPLTDEELAAAEGHAPVPWRWDGWNYGGAEFWTKDSLEGRLLGADREPVLSGVTTEGEDPRVEVRDEPSARLVEMAPRLLAEVRRLRSAVEAERKVWVADVVREQQSWTAPDSHGAMACAAILWRADQRAKRDTRDEKA